MRKKKHSTFLQSLIIYFSIITQILQILVAIAIYSRYLFIITEYVYTHERYGCDMPWYDI